MSSSSSVAPAPADDRPRRSSRVPMGVVAAVVAVLLGVGGLVVGARSGSDTGQPGTAAGEQSVPTLTGTSVGNLLVGDAYIRQPASPDVAAVYLTVQNNGNTPDQLSSAYCGAATTTSVHPDSADMSSGTDAPSVAWKIPAKTTVSLTPAKGHIMLDQLTGTLKAGDTVSLLLRFDKAGQVLIDVPVIAITAPAPGGATS